MQKRFLTNVQKVTIYMNQMQKDNEKTLYRSQPFATLAIFYKHQSSLCEHPGLESVHWVPFTVFRRLSFMTIMTDRNLIYHFNGL